jgi:hypothetical protein
MKTTGIFKTHLVRVKMKRPDDVFHLIPFGDVHVDSPHHAADRFQEDCDKWKKIKNALFLGMGDYTDFLSTSERIQIRTGQGVHESTEHKLEKAARKDITNLGKSLAFMRGKVIGCLNGNHFYQFKDGTTGDHMLANELDTTFLGVAAFIRVVFEFPGNAGRSSSIDIFAHHGAGGAQMASIAKMAGWVDADIVLQGHTHGRGVLPLDPIIRLSRNQCGAMHVVEKQRWIGRTGSYLMAYVDGDSSYNVDAGRGPCSLGHIQFELTPRRHSSDRDILSVGVRGTA